MADREVTSVWVARLPRMPSETSPLERSRRRRPGSKENAPLDRGGYGSFVETGEVRHSGGLEPNLQGFVSFRQGEVRRMTAYPPTCVTCGAVLIGWGWSKELQSFVCFCPACRERQEAPSPEMVLKKAA